MKITKNIGMLLLAVYLLIDGLLGCGLTLGPALILLYLRAIIAGILNLRGTCCVENISGTQENRKFVSEYSYLPAFLSDLDLNICRTTPPSAPVDRLGA